MADKKSRDDAILSKEEVSKIKESLGLDPSSLCPRVLTGKGYSITEAISEGGFSRVYKASGPYNGDPKHPMACKIIRLANVPQEWKERALKNELKIVTKVKHENIITIYEVTKTFRHAYLFMELAADTVTDFIRRRKKPLTEVQAWFWMSQVLKAVIYLHDRQIAHRDLKLDNLLLDKDYNIKLTDFGFATICADRKTSQVLLSTTACGTKEYMAPEILEGNPYDARIADMWSCGIILFEFLVGRNPFPIAKKEWTDAEQLKYQKKGNWSFPKGSSVSDTVVELASALLEADPKKRLTARGALNHKWFKSQP